MTRRSTAPVVEKMTDKQRILDELARLGITLDEKRITVGMLYRRVCELERRPMPRPGDKTSTPDACWVFLRRWLADRAHSVAGARETPPFQEYRHSPQMVEALKRCGMSVA